MWPLQCRPRPPAAAARIAANRANLPTFRDISFDSDPKYPKSARKALMRHHLQFEVLAHTASDNMGDF